MKKFYLFMAFALLSATQMQAVSVNDVIGTYAGTLTIGGDAQDGQIAVLPGSGAKQVTLVLPDFLFNGQSLGDIVVTNANLSTSGYMSGITDFSLYIPILATRAFVTISTPQNNVLTGTTAQLELTIDAGLPESITVTFEGARVAGNAQMPNAGFEGEWAQTANQKGYEPAGWHSFESGAGSLISMAQGHDQLQESSEVRPGSNGTKSALLTTYTILGVNANGNLTNGQISAGSISATDGKLNFNFSDPANEGFNTPFVGKPDSIAFWAKYVPTSGSKETKARMHAVITTNAYYKDPEDNSEGVDYSTVKVAEAGINYEPTEDKGWQRIAIPFEYSETVDANEAAYVLINFTTNMTPGGGNATGSNPDQLFLDDVEMIYNAALETFNLGNEAVLFTDGQATTDQAYCDSCYSIDAQYSGVGTEMYIGYNAAANQLMAYVVGGDFAANPGSCQLYTITMGSNEPHALDNTNDGMRAKKILFNGQVYILRDNQWYNVLGTRVK